MQSKRMNRLLPALACLFPLLVPGFSMAAKAAEDPASRYGTRYDLSLSPVYQPEVDIDGGGSFAHASTFLRFAVTTPVSRSTTAGLSLKYDIDDYDFTGLAGFGGAAPWNDVTRTGIGIPFFTRLENRWSLGLTPSIDWLMENGADSGESVSWGVTGFAFRSFDRARSIGLGAGAFEDVDGDARVFPFIAIDWRFNDRWRLSNPFDADALGPAGLELSYSLNERWALGSGAVYRSFRFRLDGEGVAPGGIGENDGLVGFLRLRREALSGPSLDLYVGAVMDGELALLDADGNELAASNYDTAPFAALTLGIEF